MYGSLVQELAPQLFFGATESELVAEHSFKGPLNYEHDFLMGWISELLAKNPREGSLL
jgi:hypothetical protein